MNVVCEACHSPEATPHVSLRMEFLRRHKKGTPGVFEQGSDGWLDERCSRMASDADEKIRLRLTGSELSAAIGENFLSPRWKLIKRNAHKAIYFMRNNWSLKGYVDEFDDGDTDERRLNFSWGHRWEEAAIREYEKRTGHKTFRTGLIVSQLDERLAASPDFVTKCGRLGEVKCPRKRVPSKNMMPSCYRHQVQAELFVTRIDADDTVPLVCDFVDFIPAGFKRCKATKRNDIVSPSTREPCTFYVHSVVEDMSWYPKTRPLVDAYFDDLINEIEFQSMDYTKELLCDD